MAFVVLSALSGVTLPATGWAAERAEQLLKAAGVSGGLIVHLGCGDGRLTAALCAGEGYLVQGLDAHAENVAKARRNFQSRGLYGKVTADRFDGEHLPYVDNLVNLLIADDLGKVPRAEVMRVLAPNGVALVGGKESAKPKASLSTIRKPWPDEIDQWTHYLHDADNNAVARDTRVGLPKHYQWIGAPRWLRHHDHMSGFSAMVSAKGRLFYIIDLGPRWSIQMPPQWRLIARDAFNGVVLWQRDIKKWHPHLWPLKKGPAQLMRRLVAEGDVVYVTPGVGAAVTAMDAATGRTLHTFQGTEGAEEIILHDGVLYVLVNPELDAYKTIKRDSVETIRAAGRNWNWDERPRRLVAIDAGTRKELWSKQQRVAPVTLGAARVARPESSKGVVRGSHALRSALSVPPSRLYFHDGDRVVCLEARSGKDVWASEPVARWKTMHVLFGPSLVIYEDVVLFAGGEKMDPLKGGQDTMTGLSAKTGEILWTAPHPQSGYASSEDLLVVDGLVWCGVTTSRRDSGVFTGRDPHTGEVVREFPPDDWPHMPHHRCYRAKATCNFILTSRTGIEFVDFQDKRWTAHHWVRGSCNYGILPANGLVYAPPHSCACYPVAKLNGFNAMAAARKSEVGGRKSELLDGNRLEEGSAYTRVSGLKSEIRIPNSEFRPGNGWPTYRGSAGRSGSTAVEVPVELKRAWAADIGGKLSAVTIAEGKVFVASVEDHTVHALDESSGKQLWSFTAGGRVDSPPTIWRGRVLFGSADGCVYCLRSDDGALAWRFRAAPAERRLTAVGQVESVWPVHGSVLVVDSAGGAEGVVYCVAGRTMWLDGGMRLLRLNAATGRKLSETVLDDTYPGTSDNLQKDIKWPNLPVALPDVLSYDGRHVYMRSQPFDSQGKRIEVITTRDYTEQKGETAHLFCPTGFLDDSWWHRSYWIWGRSFIGGAGGWHLASLQAPSGRILAVDEKSVYGFGRVPLRFSGTPNTYHLFACDKEPEIVNPNPKQAARRQGRTIYGKVVPTRLEYHWSESVPLLVNAMVAAKKTLFVAGPPLIAEEVDVYARYGEADIQAQMAEHVAAFKGRKGSLLMALSKADGQKSAAYRLESAPVFDGLAAAGGRLFLSTLDGKVLCLGAGKGKLLTPVPDAKPGPVSTGVPGLSMTKSHPDFQQLTTVRVTLCDIGYRIQTLPRETGLALKCLADPPKKRVEFRVKVRPVPGATSPDKPGNAFLAFGDVPKDDRLVKCGFRISGQRLYVVQGPLSGGQMASTPVEVKANQVTEIHVVVDLEEQKVTATMNDQTVEADLSRRLETVTWVGCCVSSITSDFGKIDVKAE